jgi:hypothetical protein
MIGSLKLGGYLIAALALLWLGWTVNNWRVQAARLPTVEADLVKERNARAASERARKEADDARTLASLQLETYRERTEDEIALLKSRVPVLVNNSKACAFGRELVGVLNDARRGDGQLPAAPRPTVGGAIISSATTGP